MYRIVMRRPHRPHRTRPCRRAAQRSPAQLAVAAAPVMAGGETEPIGGEFLDDPERGPDPLEGVEDQAQRLLDLLVGIEDELDGGVVDQSGGRSGAELSGPGL